MPASSFCTSRILGPFSDVSIAASCRDGVHGSPELGRVCKNISMDLVSPEDVGLSSPGLRRVDEHLRTRYLDPGRIAGALTLIARRGKVAFLSALGLMDRERSVPMRADAIFRIYSMTKPVASVALMMLHERGVFQLSDPVHKWLPGWENLRVYKYGQYP